MKEMYETPDVEFVEIEEDDVIATSGSSSPYDDVVVDD